MGVSDKKFRGFISYSRKDKRFAKMIHTALEAYRCPKGIDAIAIDPKTRKIGRFFRDDDELSASSDLGDMLKGAIQDSETLIVICSPNAARSHWVNEEILHFKRTGRQDKIFGVIAKGKPNVADDPNPRRAAKECFPLALRRSINPDGSLSNEPTEPFGIDLRTETKRKVITRLVAGILGVNYDQLWRRDNRRRKQKIAITTASVLAATLAITLGTYTTLQDSEQRNGLIIAKERAQRAIDQSNQYVFQANALQDNEGSVNVAQSSKQSLWHAAALTYALALHQGDIQDLSNRVGLSEQWSWKAQNSNELIISGKKWINALYLDPDNIRRGGSNPFSWLNLHTGEISPFELSEPVSFWSNALITNQEHSLAALNTINGRTVVFSLDTKQTLHDFPALASIQGAGITPLALSKDGSLLIRFSGPRLQIWNIETGQLITDTSPPTIQADANYYTAKPESLAISEKDEKVHVTLERLTQSGKQIWLTTYDVSQDQWSSPHILDHENAFVWVDIQQTHALISAPHQTATGKSGSILQVVELETGKITQEILPWWCAAENTGKPINICTHTLSGTSENGRYIILEALGSDPDKTVRVYDLLSDDASNAYFELSSVPGCQSDSNAYNPCYYSDYAVSPDGATIATTGNDHFIRTWQTSTAKQVQNWRPGTTRPSQIVFSGNGKKVLILRDQETSGFSERFIEVIDVATQTSLSQFGVLQKIFGAIKYVDENAQRLITYSDGKITAWTSLMPHHDETTEQALIRICSYPDSHLLQLMDDDLSAITLYQNKPKAICEWLNKE